MTIRSIEHLALAYRDTDAAAQWYCDVLGFEIIFKGTNPQGAHYFFIKDPAGTGLIEVIPMPEDNPTDLGQISMAHVHLAFDVDDMDAAIADLEAKGVEIAGPPGMMGENKLLFFRDLEGAPLQLVQRPKPLK